jgi:uncharacterized protein
LIIGVISDTHGLLRPEAVAALRGSEAILHAGDVGDRGILEELGRLAPVTAVRGNVDRGELARELPPTALFEGDDTLVYMLHDLEDFELDPRAAGIGVVVSGHTHTPLIQEIGGVLYLNPGSAGPRRFHLPVCVATLTLGGGAPTAKLVRLME